MKKPNRHLALLHSEGFSTTGYVDIFDAGPTVEAKLEHIRTARNSRRLQVRVKDVSGGQPYLVCNTDRENFRAGWAHLHVNETSEEVNLPLDIAAGLKVQDGDWVRLARL